MSHTYLKMDMDILLLESLTRVHLHKMCHIAKRCATIVTRVRCSAIILTDFKYQLLGANLDLDNTPLTSQVRAYTRRDEGVRAPGS